MKSRTDVRNAKRRSRAVSYAAPNRHLRGTLLLWAMCVLAAAFFFLLVLSWFPLTGWPARLVRGFFGTVYAAFGVGVLIDAGNPLRGGKRAQSLGGVALILFGVMLFLGYGEMGLNE